MPNDGTPTEPKGLSTGAAALWLAARGLTVDVTTVQHWCREGCWRHVARRTPGGHYRIPLATLRALLAENDLAALAA